MSRRRPSLIKGGILGETAEFDALKVPEKIAYAGNRPANSKTRPLIPGKWRTKDESSDGWGFGVNKEQNLPYQVEGVLGALEGLFAISLHESPQLEAEARDILEKFAQPLKAQRDELLEALERTKTMNPWSEEWQAIRDAAIKRAKESA